MRELLLSDFQYLLLATRWTLVLGAIALIGGGFGGLIIALARTARTSFLVQLARIYIIIFQGTPLLMQLFLCFFGPPIFGLDINPLIAASMALILNTSAFLGDIWRGSIHAVPHAQTEAAYALNLKNYHRLRHIVLPQAAKIAMPPTVGFMVQIVKGTSLTAIIGFVELTRTGQIINSATFEPMKVFAFVALIYFCICWPMSRLSRHLELRFSVSSR